MSARGADAASFGPPAWRGQRGRTEVWYATFTDAASGTGGWVHAETVAPTDGSSPYAHGWVAVFPADRSPSVERFGPAPIEPQGAAWFRAGDVIVDDGRLRGRAGSILWDLTLEDSGPPLFTFPRTVWERHLLPAAQIVPWPSARVRGSLTVAGEERNVDGRGALARIYGHGNAERWGWLHAPLDEDGGVLEIVAATARRRSLRRLRPLAMVQLREPGLPDWPANPALASPRFRTELRADGFTVVGGAGGARLHVEVRLPPDRSVSLRYTDPDGATATCTNSERASVSITLERGGGGRAWRLDGIAHAEVGHRPADPAAV